MKGKHPFKVSEMKEISSILKKNEGDHWEGTLEWPRFCVFRNCVLFQETSVPSM